MKIEYFLVVLIILAFIIFACIILRKFSLSKEARQALHDAAVLGRIRKKEKGATQFYHFFRKLPFTRRYTTSIEQMYNSVCPYSDTFLKRLSAVTAIIASVVSVILILGITVINVICGEGLSIYCIASYVFGIYVVTNEVMHIRFSSADNKMTTEIVDYLASVKHLFSIYKNIPRAVNEASDGKGYEMRVHANQLYDILCSADRMERVKAYVLSNKTNKHLRTFLSQAYEVSEQGDKIEPSSGESLFAKNVEFQRVEILRDMYTRKKKAYALQGFAFVSVAPLFFLGLLKSWGIGFSEEMADFYAGAGKLVVILMFLITWLVYDIINKAREVRLKQKKKGEKNKKAPTPFMLDICIKAEKSFRKPLLKLQKMLAVVGDNTRTGFFFLKMCILAGTFFVLMLGFFEMLNIQKRHKLVTDKDKFYVVVTTTNETLRNSIADEALALVKEYRKTKLDDLDKARIREIFCKKVYVPNDAIIDSVMKEIESRISKYRKTYLKWYAFLGSIIFGVLMGSIPLIELYYRYNLVLGEKDDEIHQFQAVILMERHFDDVSIVGLLEQMETFAVVYAGPIRECINNFSAGPNIALMQLKHAVGENVEFSELIDGFIAADNIGIKLAFEELENNREIHEKVRELENEISFSKKMDSTEIFAMVPSVIALGAYFIAPFAISALSGVFDIFNVLQDMDTELKLK